MALASIGPVVISPFANERVREWPAEHFRRIIELIWRVHRLPMVVVGTRSQRARANDIVRGFSSERVINASGTMKWADLVAAIGAAPYIVANNSGVAHLGAAWGRWTLCVFAASHAFIEWMPRGPRVVVITRVVPCSPCALATEFCPNGRACMVDMLPDEVFWRFDEVRSAGTAADALAEAR